MKKVVVMLGIIIMLVSIGVTAFADAMAPNILQAPVKGNNTNTKGVIITIIIAVAIIALSIFLILKGKKGLKDVKVNNEIKNGEKNEKENKEKS